jgi:hypothetical protein
MYGSRLPREAPSTYLSAYFAPEGRDVPGGGLVSYFRAAAYSGTHLP